MIPVGNRLETNIDVRGVEFPVSLLTIGKVNPSHEWDEETHGLPFLDSYLNHHISCTDFISFMNALCSTLLLIDRVEKLAQ